MAALKRGARLTEDQFLAEIEHLSRLGCTYVRVPGGYALREFSLDDLERLLCKNLEPGSLAHEMIHHPPCEQAA